MNSRKRKADKGVGSIGLVRQRVLKRAKKFDEYNAFARDIVLLCEDHERLETMSRNYEKD